MEAELTATALTRVRTIAVALSGRSVFPIDGYHLSESPLPPAASSGTWLSAAPTMFTLGDQDGAKVLYGFVRDSRDFVSLAATARVRVDSVAPTVVISVPKKDARLAQLTQIKRTKSDPAPRSGITSERYAIRMKQGALCKWWKPATERLVAGKCNKPRWFGLPPGRRWSQAIGTLDDAGLYTLLVQATDRARNVGKASRRFAIVAAGVPARR